MKIRKQLQLWLEQHWMLASLFPLGIEELSSRLGLHRILTSRDFWQDWVFEEFLLSDLRELLVGVFTPLV